MVSDPIAALIEKIETDPEFAREFVEGSGKLLESYNALVHTIGALAIKWAALDAAVDELFEPLLDCSGAQVACILVENISTRCDMLKRLLHVEPLPTRFTEWLEALLSRASGELASKRNRYIHDRWRIDAERATRTDKRAKLGKPQSRQRRKLSFNTEHETTAKEIELLGEQVSTVNLALRAATKSLRLWRAEGPRPKVSKQWLPASKPSARVTNYQADPAAPEIPLVPLNYEFH